MLLHADEIATGAQINTQVCIVGAGAAGITLALELAQAGIDVVLLDGADQPYACASEASGYSTLYEGEEGEFLSATTQRYPLPDDPDGPTWMTLTRKRSLGGSTNGWGGTCTPLQPIDFNPPGLPGIPWPFTRADLDPFYARAIPYIHLGKMAFFEIGHWTGIGYADPFAGHPHLRTVVAQQADRTNWKFQCAHGSRLKDARLRLIQGASMVGLNFAHGRVEAVQAGSADGKSHFRVACKHAVLAAGGVENVRLLFNAGLERFPNGLGNNPAGMLGRFFSVHPLISGAAFVAGRGPTFGGIYRSPPPNPQPENVHIKPWVTATSGAMKDLEIANFRIFLASVPSGIVVNLTWQQVSNPHSAITPVAETDRLGQRRVKVDWQLTRQDHKTASSALDLLEQWLIGQDPSWTLKHRFDQSRGACMSEGVGWHVYRGYGTPGVWAAEHHMGATRMAVDPNEGIVDADSRVHTVENLFVAGSSVFPQTGFSNPTFTIVALAIRLADHLKTLA